MRGTGRAWTKRGRPPRHFKSAAIRDGSGLSDSQSSPAPPFPSPGSADPGHQTPGDHRARYPHRHPRRTRPIRPARNKAASAKPDTISHAASQPQSPKKRTALSTQQERPKRKTDRTPAQQRPQIYDEAEARPLTESSITTETPSLEDSHWSSSASISHSRSTASGVNISAPQHAPRTSGFSETTSRSTNTGPTTGGGGPRHPSPSSGSSPSTRRYQSVTKPPQNHRSGCTGSVRHNTLASQHRPVTNTRSVAGRLDSGSGGTQSA